ncbi:alanine dehydrogenase [Sulfurivermis fontis]|uniref:alanine dehydrogenase n=1 Tax=Sulfurivermis fontis TaxID=1972068 RepID=UPI000FDC952E|nr:alanine dehydrogenase [Sulfurivermis fontis]
MRIGIPREVKTLEGRVGLIPAAAAELVRAGHEVAVQHDAGRLSGYADADYQAAGVSVLPDAAALYGWAQLVVKVKEPQPQEWPLLRADHLLFCYLHLAAEPALTQELLRIGLTAVGFETVEEADGRLPLLAPMSDIAGRIAAQAGAWLLTAPQGGKGLLLGGLPAAERGHVVVLGAGVAGGSAARVAAALGAQVTVFDRNRDKLAMMRALGDNVTALYPYADAIERAVLAADLLVGAVLIPGARAPHLVSADTVRAMQPGSVVVDISVDQGGCIETTRPTTWAAPTYVWENVVHFGVTNMPGSVPRTASQALSAALIPYVQRLAQGGWEAQAALARGVNVRGGAIVHPALQQL